MSYIPWCYDVIDCTTAVVSLLEDGLENRLNLPQKALDNEIILC